MKNIVLAIISNHENKKVFLQKRQSRDFLHGFWELPGGKVEPGETCEQAIKRELKEELSSELFQHLQMERLKRLGDLDYNYSDHNLILRFTVYEIPVSEFVIEESKVDQSFISLDGLESGIQYETMPPATKEVFKKFGHRLLN